MMNANDIVIAESDLKAIMYDCIRSLAINDVCSDDEVVGLVKFSDLILAQLADYK